MSQDILYLTFKISKSKTYEATSCRACSVLMSPMMKSLITRINMVPSNLHGEIINVAKITKYKISKCNKKRLICVPAIKSRWCHCMGNKNLQNVDAKEVTVDASMTLSPP